MSTQVLSVKVPVHQVVERIFKFRQISRLDQQLLMSALLSKDALDQTEQTLVNQIFDALKKGLLRVVD